MTTTTQTRYRLDGQGLRGRGGPGRRVQGATIRRDAAGAGARPAEPGAAGEGAVCSLR
jgi:hypothetical protein